jgi:glycosyltransferase involved in cell wall biosynthesis
MAIGLPVLVSDIPLHRELVGKAGLCFKFGAKAVADLLADPERRERMGKAGIQRVTENFNWATEAKKLIDFVEKG